MTSTEAMLLHVQALVKEFWMPNKHINLLWHYAGILREVANIIHK